MYCPAPLTQTALALSQEKEQQLLPESLGQSSLLPSLPLPFLPSGCLDVCLCAQPSLPSGRERQKWPVQSYDKSPGPGRLLAAQLSVCVYVCPACWLPLSSTISSARTPTLCAIHPASLVKSVVSSAQLNDIFFAFSTRIQDWLRISVNLTSWSRSRLMQWWV